MKTKVTIAALITALASLGILAIAQAQTVDTRCDLYPIGEDQASAVVPCTFSQRQGFIRITLNDETTYELSPSHTEANAYTDQEGKPASRELIGEGDIGQIYRLADESIYVYWDTAGLPELVESQTYDETESGVPVTAQYPSTMQVLSTASGEGVGVFFRFTPKNNALDDAEVSIFLPSNTSSTSDLGAMTTGPNSLIESNGWNLVGSRTGTTSEFPYPWVEMVFDISTDFEQDGHILIGESNGQAFRVILLYPAGMIDEFWADAQQVLDSLQFEPSLLPI
ncbi:MAG: hypothetical protein AB4050_20025 [Synechococcus sp.]